MVVGKHVFFHFRVSKLYTGINDYLTTISGIIKLYIVNRSISL